MTKPVFLTVLSSKALSASHRMSIIDGNQDSMISNPQEETKSETQKWLHNNLRTQVSHSAPCTLHLAETFSVQEIKNQRHLKYKNLHHGL